MLAEHTVLSGHLGTAGAKTAGNSLTHTYTLLLVFPSGLGRLLTKQKLIKPTTVAADDDAL